ncbi:MAG: hypothetical protein K0R33_2363, partial [Mycobacterium sp.]|nr:hypothetical protein [Mycobacterium sp.]
MMALFGVTEEEARRERGGLSRKCHRITVLGRGGVPGSSDVLRVVV